MKADIRMMPETVSSPHDSSDRSRKLRILAVGLGAAGILCVLAFAIIFVVLGSIKSGAVTVGAVERARSNPEVVEKIGVPVETGWWVSGSLSVTGPSGQADLAVPLHGPRGKGTLYFRAEKVAGEWRYTLMEFAVAGRKDHIQLLTEQERSGV